MWLSSAIKRVCDFQLQKKTMFLWLSSVIKYMCDFELNQTYLRLLTESNMCVFVCVTVSRSESLPFIPPLVLFIARCKYWVQGFAL